MDYCGNLADIVASWILVSCWRRPNSHCFGDRRDCGRNQARHGSGSLGVRLRQELRVKRLTKTSNKGLHLRNALSTTAKRLESKTALSN